MNIARVSLSCFAVALVAASGAQAAFNSFVIRNDGGGNPPQILPNNVYVPGATEFVISAGSMKAGFGTNDYAGATLGDITQLAITRHDNSARFTAGSGAAVAPYFNIWVTDGVNYAVVANEPSNPSFAAFRTPGPNGGFTYSFSMAQLAAEQCNVFEAPNAGTKTDWLHVALGKSGQLLTFADVMGMTLGAPSAAYIAGGNGIGGGAPRELGSNNAVAINWIFGDTLANYVSGAEGYVVSNAIVLPAPGSVALLGLGGLLAARRRRA